jgi:dTDP-4-dehydrorhamnose 3,5-epimerase
MKVNKTDLPGVLLLEPQVFGDGRGFFFESFQDRRYAEIGIDLPFAQDNLSRSGKGTLRGLHFQEPFGQGKLVMVVRGTVFDVVADVRRGSPTFGKWVGFELSDQNHHQIWIPPGFAHGFCVTSDEADFFYKCTTYYAPQAERGVLWNDPQLGIAWPIENPNLSAKDAKNPLLKDASVLPQYEEL